jgi:hypothetical protein
LFASCEFATKPAHPAHPFNKPTHPATKPCSPCHQNLLTLPPNPSQVNKLGAFDLCAWQKSPEMLHQVQEDFESSAKPGLCATAVAVAAMMTLMM